jgi:hypothetical protein
MRLNSAASSAEVIGDVIELSGLVAGGATVQVNDGDQNFDGDGHGKDCGKSHHFPLSMSGNCAPS